MKVMFLRKLRASLGTCQDQYICAHEEAFQKHMRAIEDMGISLRKRTHLQHKILIRRRRKQSALQEIVLKRGINMAGC